DHAVSARGQLPHEFKPDAAARARNQISRHVPTIPSLQRRHSITPPRSQLAAVLHFIPPPPG
ncbi:MAG: hypothetical protein ABIP49_08075, partial [Lysobacterales bacterium]